MAGGKLGSGNASRPYWDVRQFDRWLVVYDRESVGSCPRACPTVSVLGVASGSLYRAPQGDLVAAHDGVVITETQSGGQAYGTSDYRAYSIQRRRRRPAGRLGEPVPLDLSGGVPFGAASEALRDAYPIGQSRRRSGRHSRPRQARKKSASSLCRSSGALIGAARSGVPGLSAIGAASTGGSKPEGGAKRGWQCSPPSAPRRPRPDSSPPGTVVTISTRNSMTVQDAVASRRGGTPCAGRGGHRAGRCHGGAGLAGLHGFGLLCRRAGALVGRQGR